MLDEKLILDSLNHGINSFKLLVNVLNTNKKELMAMLNSLVNEQKVYYDHHLDSFYILKEAKLSIKPQGYAFASVDGEEADYFIPASGIPNNAYNNDIALIYPYEKGVKLVNANVYKIIKRSHEDVIGILKESTRKKGPKYYIESTISDFAFNVIVSGINLGDAKPGNLVRAKLNYTEYHIYGTITEILGNINDKGIEITEIALEYGFKKDFSINTIDELNDIPNEVLEPQINGRKDFRNKKAITIDGDDSKDFDDAVYAEKNNDYYHLEVYIADVAEYVKENTSLDKDALSRGTSVYLADTVIPMLPKKLSNGICSLNEGEDRLVLACLMDIDYKGNLINYEICEGIINSHHRMTYNNVNKILDGDLKLIDKYNDIYEMLKEMLELSSIIRERRYKKGGIEFETDEYKFKLDENGKPISTELRLRGKAEKIIEDFMLEANETIAYNMNIMNLPCVYRIHEKPDQEKLQGVFELISNMGIKVKSLKNDIHPKEIQDALEKINNTPYAPIINSLLLRSMMKAKYSETCSGHYGLAMQYYCHFTSPIRRYPDLMVHRLIKKLLIHPIDLENELMKYEEIVQKISMLTSASERNAVDCERAVEDMLSAWLMSSFKNKKFNGIITSVTGFGLYVTLDNGIEGLVAYQNMDGYFEFDSKKLIATDRKRTFKLGDSVEIYVINSNKKSRKIDFMLAEDFENYEDCML